MWDLVPQPGMEPGPPDLGAWSLSHWTTREVPLGFCLTRHHHMKMGDIEEITPEENSSSSAQEMYPSCGLGLEDLRGRRVTTPHGGF